MFNDMKSFKNLNINQNIKTENTNIDEVNILHTNSNQIKIDLNDEDNEEVSLASRPSYNPEDLQYLYYCKGSNNGCNKTGHVYGCNPYSDDSNFCLAAKHSGIVQMSGGYYLIKPNGSLNHFPGTSQNGVTTIRYEQVWNSVNLVEFHGASFGTSECGKVNIWKNWTKFS